MISRDALYDFVEDLIDNAEVDSPLDGAQVFRNLRTSIDEAVKVVRVECFLGDHCMTTEETRKELAVEFTIQCWVIPDLSDGELAGMDAAVDDSFDMSRVIFEAMATDTSLGGRVCDSYSSKYESGEASMGTLSRGVTFLDGVINQAS